MARRSAPASGRSPVRPRPMPGAARWWGQGSAPWPARRSRRSPANEAMRRVLTWLGVIAAIPVLLVGALWLGQERMIFLPDDRVIAAAPGWTRETLRAPDGTDLAFLAT